MPAYTRQQRSVKTQIKNIALMIYGGLLVKSGMAKEDDYSQTMPLSGDDYVAIFQPPMKLNSYVGQLVIHHSYLGQWHVDVIGSEAGRLNCKLSGHRCVGTPDQAWEAMCHFEDRRGYVVSLACGKDEWRHMPLKYRTVRDALNSNAHEMVDAVYVYDWLGIACIRGSNGEIAVYSPVLDARGCALFPAKQ